MKRPDSSLNKQFNEQYEEVIVTIQERAIWRVGERATELDQFRCLCPNCGYESLHQRVDIARHRLLFGRSIRQIEAPRPMVRCQRCGVQRHTRDIDQLVVPTTMRLHERVIASVPTAGARSTPLDASLTTALVAFRDEASLPVCRSLLVDIAAEAGPTDAAFIEAVGRALFISGNQVADIVSGLD